MSLCWLIFVTMDFEVMFHIILSGISNLCAFSSQQHRTDTMSFVGDKADKMAEKAAFEAGGYPGLIKFKAFRAYQAIKECSCCA